MAAAARDRRRLGLAGEERLGPLAVRTVRRHLAHALEVAAGARLVTAPVPAVGQAVEELHPGVTAEALEVILLQLEDALVIAEPLVEELGALRLGDERRGRQQRGTARDAGADVVWRQ